MLTMLTSNADFVWDSLRNFAGSTGIAGFFSEMGWGSVAMICVAFFLLYLAIRHKFEPLLLFTIAFGMLLTCPVRTCTIPSFSPTDMSTGIFSWLTPDCSTTSTWV